MVQSARSTFYMCQRSFTDPAYRKYPALPMLRCPGFRLRGEGDGPAPDQGDGSDKLSE